MTACLFQLQRRWRELKKESEDRHLRELIPCTICLLSWYLVQCLRFQAPSWVFLVAFSPHQTPSGYCTGGTPELHGNGLHRADRHSVSICSLCEHQSVLMTTWRRKVKHLEKNGHTNQGQTCCFHQHWHLWPRKLNACVCESRRYFRSFLTFMFKRFRLCRKNEAESSPNRDHVSKMV